MINSIQNSLFPPVPELNPSTVELETFLKRTEPLGLEKNPALYTPLHIAIGCENIPWCLQLLENGALATDNGQIGMCPFILALRLGREDIARLCFEFQGFSIKQMFDAWKDPINGERDAAANLIFLKSKENVQFLQELQLIQHHEHIGEKSLVELAVMQSEKDEHAAFSIVHRKSLAPELFEWEQFRMELFREHSDLFMDPLDHKGRYSSFHVAVGCGDLNWCMQHLERGFSAMARQLTWCSPFVLAVLLKKFNVAELLLKERNEEIRNKFASLEEKKKTHIERCLKDPECIEFLLSNKLIQANTRWACIALKKKYVRGFEYLVNQGAAIPPLHLAATLGNLDECRRLINSGVSPTHSESLGISPFILALLCRRNQIADFFLQEKRGEIEQMIHSWRDLKNGVANIGGNAILFSDPDTIEYLFEHGLIHKEDNVGNLKLVAFVLSHNKYTVDGLKYLLFRGCNLLNQVVNKEMWVLDFKNEDTGSYEVSLSGNALFLIIKKTLDTDSAELMSIYKEQWLKYRDIFPHEDLRVLFFQLIRLGHDILKNPHSTRAREFWEILELILQTVPNSIWVEKPVPGYKTMFEMLEWDLWGMDVPESCKKIRPIVNLKKKNKGCSSPLTLAVVCEDQQWIAQLLVEGASPKDNEGQAFNRALHLNKKDVILSFLKDSTSMLACAARGELEQCERLMQTESCTDSEAFGISPFILSLLMGQHAITKLFLVHQKPQIEKMIQTWRCPVTGSAAVKQNAVFLSQPEAIQFLIDEKLIDKDDSIGNKRILHCAMSCRWANGAGKLLELGANVRKLQVNREIVGIKKDVFAIQDNAFAVILSISCGEKNLHPAMSALFRECFEKCKLSKDEVQIVLELLIVLGAEVLKNPQRRDAREFLQIVNVVLKSASLADLCKPLHYSKRVFFIGALYWPVSLKDLAVVCKKLQTLWELRQFGLRFSLEGALFGGSDRKNILQSLYDSFHERLEISYDLKNPLLEEFRGRPLNNMIKRFKKQKIVFVHSGWNGNEVQECHVVAAIFHGKFCAKINTGAGSTVEEPPGVNFYEIQNHDPEAVPLVIRKLVENRDVFGDRASEAKYFWMIEINKELKLKKIHQIKYEQRGPNCGYEAGRYAGLTYLIFLNIFKNKLNVCETSLTASYKGLYRDYFSWSGSERYSIFLKGWLNFKYQSKQIGLSWKSIVPKIVQDCFDDPSMSRYNESILKEIIVENPEIVHWQHSRTNQSLLMCAYDQNMYSLVEIILDLKPNLFVKDKWGETFFDDLAKKPPPAELGIKIAKLKAKQEAAAIVRKALLSQKLTPMQKAQRTVLLSKK